MNVNASNLTSDHSGYLLTSDNQGNASWAALRPFGAIITGKLNDSRVNITGSGTDITSKRIRLPAGQWLVFGLFNTETVVPNSGVNKGVVMYNWINLNSKPINGGTERSERLGGTNPESKGAGQLAYATPSFSHYINVKVPTEIWVVGVSSNSDRNQTVSNTETNLGFLGPSYFFAVRLDVAID